MAKKIICSACGQVGDGKTKIKGNSFIELILWLSFIIPGLIYSVWRSNSRYKACPSCGSTNLIPIDSPIGQKLLIDQGKNLQEIQNEQKALDSKTFKRKLIIGGVIILIFLTWLVIIA